MSDLAEFIVAYLEEFDEDTPQAIINTYARGHGAEVSVVDAVFDALRRLTEKQQVTLGMMRDRPEGGHDFAFVTTHCDVILSQWRKDTVWDDARRCWAWARKHEFWPYIVLGTKRKWRSATPEEIAEDERKYSPKPRKQGH